MLEGVRVIVSLCSFCGSSSYAFPGEVSNNFLLWVNVIPRILAL